MFFPSRNKNGVNVQKHFKIIWGSTFVDWIHLASLGASHGLLLLWHKQVVEKLEDFR